MTHVKSKTICFLQDFSIPLIFGVIVALGAANVTPQLYHDLVHGSVVDLFSSESEAHHPHASASHDHSSASQQETESKHSSLSSPHGQFAKLTNGGNSQGHHLSKVKHSANGHSANEHSDHHASQIAAASHQSAADGSHDHGHSGWAHFFSLHFLVNDLFMVLFFGIAAKEITEACLPGGSLNPMRKAINPLLGTLGGVFGPIATFLALNWMFGAEAWTNGWGIPTATDIALAWLAARFIFGAGHPAITFLLLLAVADDAIGLGIIAIAYPDPNHPTQWMNALWIVPGMLSAFTLRKLDVQSWVPYIAIGGAFCWCGLYFAHLHPALALVFVVPFLPAPKRDYGLFVDTPETSNESAEVQAARIADHNSPLHQFEHDCKLFVDFGLFFFAFANAGVAFSNINNLTWILLASLVIGKTAGITLFSGVGTLLGFKLPDGMEIRHLVVASMIAGIGLTVALFVSGQAFTDPTAQGAAKMGSLFSAFGFAAAFIAARALGIRPLGSEQKESAPSGEGFSFAPTWILNALTKTAPGVQK